MEILPEPELTKVHRYGSIRPQWAGKGICVVLFSICISLTHLSNNSVLRKYSAYCFHNYCFMFLPVMLAFTAWPWAAGPKVWSIALVTPSPAGLSTTAGMPSSSTVTGSWSTVTGPPGTSRASGTRLRTWCTNTMTSISWRSPHSSSTVTVPRTHHVNCSTQLDPGRSSQGSV